MNAATLNENSGFGLETEFLGTLSYAAGRSLQEEAVRARRAGECGDKLFLCEHPAVLTCGTRTKESDLPLNKNAFEIVTVTRGGSVTWHGPGQLVIYPVISLRDRHLGVRRFVELGLDAIVQALNHFGISSVARTDLAGVWVNGKNAPEKIAAVGLKIEHGVSNHGFSLNICNDLSVYKNFLSCGLKDTAATSMSALSGQKFSLEEVVTQISLAFSANFR